MNEKNSQKRQAKSSSSKSELARISQDNYQHFKQCLTNGETFLNETINLWEIEEDKREELRKLNQINKQIIDQNQQAKGNKSNSLGNSKQETKNDLTK